MGARRATVGHSRRKGRRRGSGSRSARRRRGTAGPWRVRGGSGEIVRGWGGGAGVIARTRRGGVVIGVRSPREWTRFSPTQQAGRGGRRRGAGGRPAHLERSRNIREWRMGSERMSSSRHSLQVHPCRAQKAAQDWELRRHSSVTWGPWAGGAGESSAPCRRREAEAVVEERVWGVEGWLPSAPARLGGGAAVRLVGRVATPMSPPQHHCSR